MVMMMMIRMDKLVDTETEGLGFHLIHSYLMKMLLMKMMVIWWWWCWW